MPEEKKKVEEGTDKPQDGAGDKETLLAGKFKSKEDLIEGYQNLERAFHSSTDEAKKWKRSVEEMLSATPEPDKDKLAADAEEFSEKFLANPGPVLDEFASQVRKSVLKDVNEYLSARDVVTKFLSTNAELEANPKLFALNLAETDPNKSITERLESAKEAYEKEIDGIRTKAKDKEKSRKEFEKRNKADAVDTGEGAGRDMPKKGDSDDDSDEDDNFASYIEERKAERARISSLL